MNTSDPKFKLRLGIFIAGGLVLFVLAIFFIGRQKNLFDPVYVLSSTFYNVSGLQVGNNVRFSGINVGTVDNIRIINDSTVQVDMLIKKSVNQFIKTDSEVAIGSEGLIGDRILIVTQGGTTSPIATEGANLLSVEPVETDAIMASLEVTAVNAEIITSQLAEIMVNINSGNGTLGRLIQDTTMAENLDQTMRNLKNSSKGLNENMDAAKDNILLRGYFKKKKREAEKRKESREKK